MFWDILFNYSVEKLGFILVIAAMVGLFFGVFAPIGWR